MTGTVTRHPGADLAAARAVVNAPHLYTDDEIMRAHQVLCRGGTVSDIDVADSALLRLATATVDRDMRASREAARLASSAIGAACLFFVVLLMSREFVLGVLVAVVVQYLVRLVVLKRRVRRPVFPRKEPS